MREKSRRIVWTIVSLSLVLGVKVQAGEIGHFAGGLVNIRDVIMPPAPGVYTGVYYYYYTTDQLNNANGNKISSVNINPGPGPGVTVNLHVDVEIDVIAPILMWVAPPKILGAHYGGFIVPSVADSGLDAALSTATGRGVGTNTKSFGVGDLCVVPIWLDWSFTHWDFGIAYGFAAPVGKYNTETITLPRIGRSVTVESIDNIGYGFWEQQVQGSMAWYPMASKATAVVTALTYETCGKKEDFNLTPGDWLTLNWGISQYLPLKKDMTVLAEVGVAGYDTWQITDDSGSAAKNVHDQVHAIGGQLGITHVPWNAVLNFHYFYEFAAKDRFQGQVLAVSLAKKF